jgi:hypothetical protein
MIFQGVLLAGFIQASKDFQTSGNDSWIFYDVMPKQLSSGKPTGTVSSCSLNCSAHAVTDQVSLPQQMFNANPTINIQLASPEKIASQCSKQKWSPSLPPSDCK